MSDTDPAESLGSDKACGAAIVIGGLAGGMGVALMAMAAHLPDGERLLTSAQMLLFHAPAFLALAALHGTGPRFLLPLTVIVLTLGVLLFCGDVTMRVLVDHRIFPMAAPTGGGLMIAGWTGVLLLGVARLMRRA